MSIPHGHHPNPRARHRHRAMTEGATTIHFILIAIFAIGAVAILARGRYLRRRRGRADKQHVQNNEVAETPSPIND